MPSANVFLDLKNEGTLKFLCLNLRLIKPLLIWRLKSIEAVLREALPSFPKL